MKSKSKTRFKFLLQELAADVENIEIETIEYLLSEITCLLDDLDQEDAFGTEGWRRRYTIPENK